MSLTVPLTSDRTDCGTPWPPISSRGVPTYAACRRFLATPRWPPRRSTPTSRMSGSEAPTNKRILAPAATSSEVRRRITQAAVQPQHQMKVTARGEAGAADVTDDLPPGDALSHVHHITGRVVEPGDHMTPVDEPMIDHQPIAVTGADGYGTNPAGLGRSDR